MKKIVWPLPAAALLALAASAGGASAAGDAATAQVRRRPRRHGPACRGGQEGGRAQRHRPAARLGQLRRDDEGLRAEVRHQDQQRPARRQQPGRDQRRQAAQGPEARPRRVRPRHQRRAAQHRPARPLQGRDLGRHPRPAEGAERPLVQRLRRLHVDRLRRRQAAGDHGRQRPAEARLQGQGRAERQPDPGLRRLQRRHDGLARQRRLGRRHQARASTSSRSSSRPATSCRSTRPRPPSRRARPRS